MSSFPSTRDEEQEFTRVYYGGETVIDTILQFLNKSNDIIYACVDQTRPSLTIDIALLKEAFLDAKRRGVKLFYITEITRDNLSYCKQLITMVDELRHLDGIKGNFYISETGYLAPATFHEKGKPASQIIYSNVKELIEHQRYVFDTFWDKAISAEQRIREIEEEREPDFYEVITDNEKASQILIDLAKAVKKEALFLLPNDKDMLRLDRMGLIDYTIKASQNGATVKIICPMSEANAKVVKRISERAPQIQVLNGNISPYGMYIVDNERFLRAELRQPEAKKFSEAIGLVVYSNRRITVDSFKSIFELLWKEHESVEEVKRAYRMQKEFINIASHEMKTPTQAILGYTGLLRQHPEKRDQMIQGISRNALRLQRLTNDILDVTRIESQTLNLNKEQFNLKYLITGIVEDYRRQIQENKSNVRLLYDIKRHKKNSSLTIDADRGRITQVLSNLLNNAIKFASEKKERGQVVSVSTVADYASKNNDCGEIIVSIKDSGEGIHPDILPRLFTRFATKSFTGTGLGLYISKYIVEAHGGRIWAENNHNGEGATFRFSLPLAQKN
ncbi:MAG: HAMP domain-containing sensor histidine kinase [Nitrososphaeraceae archaeon]